jgi:hypothetical protein
MIKDMRFDLNIISIFLNEEDLNIEARQLNNEKDKKENAADSCSNFAAKSK